MDDQEEQRVSEPDTTTANPPSADDLETVRALILRAHPDVVPELVTGTTVAELTASIEPAHAAYERIAGRQSPATGNPPAVPAGGATAVIDPATLPTTEKIRRGLAARARE
jgi:hypothetical protein